MTIGPVIGRPRVAAEEDWRSAGACLSADPDLFFPISGSGRSMEQAAQAKAVCARCLVQGECLGFALRTRQAHGIWGGLTAEERHQAINADARTVCTAAGDAA